MNTPIVKDQLLAPGPYSFNDPIGVDYEIDSNYVIYRSVSCDRD